MKRWGAIHSAIAGTAVVTAAIAMLAEGQLSGLVVLGFAAIFFGFAIYSARRGEW